MARDTVGENIWTTTSNRISAAKMLNRSPQKQNNPVAQIRLRLSSSSPSFTCNAYENSSRPVTPHEQSNASSSLNHSTLVFPCKRRAAEEEVATLEYCWDGLKNGSADHEEDGQMVATHPPPLAQKSTWCLALAMDLEEMPAAGGSNRNESGVQYYDWRETNGNLRAERRTAGTSIEESAAQNPIKSEIEMNVQLILFFISHVIPNHFSVFFIIFFVSLFETCICSAFNHKIKLNQNLK